MLSGYDFYDYIVSVAVLLSDGFRIMLGTGEDLVQGFLGTLSRNNLDNGFLWSSDTYSPRTRISDHGAVTSNASSPSAIALLSAVINTIRCIESS